MMLPPHYNTLYFLKKQYTMSVIISVFIKKYPVFMKFDFFLSAVIIQKKSQKGQ